MNQVAAGIMETIRTKAPDTYEQWICLIMNASFDKAIAVINDCENISHWQRAQLTAYINALKDKEPCE